MDGLIRGMDGHDYHHYHYLNLFFWLLSNATLLFDFVIGMGSPSSILEQWQRQRQRQANEEAGHGSGLHGVGLQSSYQLARLGGYWLRSDGDEDAACEDN